MGAWPRSYGLAVALALAATCAHSNRASAAPGATTSPYRVDLGVDLTVTSATVLISAAFPLFGAETVTLECHPCDAADLNVLDRRVVDREFDDVDTLTDVLLAAALCAPFLVAAAEAGMSESEGRWQGFWDDSLVVGEAVASTVALNQIVKHLVRRPRPYAYRLDPASSSEVPADTTVSFYSGHTATAFTAAVALAQTYSYRHEDGLGSALVWASALTLASATGVGRVLAGRHFWTDVLVGAGMGAGMGWLIPWLHRRDHDGSSDVTIVGLPLGVAGTF